MILHLRARDDYNDLLITLHYASDHNTQNLSMAAHVVWRDQFVYTDNTKGELLLTSEINKLQVIVVLLTLVMFTVGNMLASLRAKSNLFSSTKSSFTSSVTPEGTMSYAQRTISLFTPHH